ncbi:DUF6510 family protein [Curtobacterium pusillum]|uniref:DUF6510 family protein n=1 Tax=Curtobacterium pusillum TaxID=69373 RepID=UPI0011A5B479|nr:DUF6510 family protein [Curtobacterium pusillum]
MIVDGNALAGDLTDVIGDDATRAVVRCAACGETGELAGSRVFRTAMGSVARCRGCDAVLVTIVDAGQRTWIAFPGIRAVAPLLE